MRANLKWKLINHLVGSCLVLGIMIGIVGCDQPVQVNQTLSAVTNDETLTTTNGSLAEVNIPASIARIAPKLDKFQPQVRIISPQPDETLTDDRVTVKLAVSDLQLFKQPELGLGNHLHVILDKQTYQGVYDLRKPLVFENLAAGTHSLRIFASRPWHESFKNAGAYAQVSFNVLTKTAENNPDSTQPLLTYSRPTGTYGAEPIMLDYYLTNGPISTDLNQVQSQLPGWRIRVTVNEQRFILDRWAPVYLQGFKPGKNWIRLELLDDHGQPIPNVYNDTVGIINYNPQANDTLARLVKGEIDPTLANSLVDPSYVAIAPTPIPLPLAVPVAIPNPTSDQVIVSTPAPVTQPIPTPVVIVPVPTVKPSSSSIDASSAQIPALTPVPTPALNPIQIVQPAPSPVVITPTPIASSSPPSFETLPTRSPATFKVIEPSATLAPIPAPAISATNAVPTVPVVQAPQPIQVPAPIPIPSITPILPAISTDTQPQAIVVKQPVAALPITPDIAQPDQPSEYRSENTSTITMPPIVGKVDLAIDQIELKPSTAVTNVPVNTSIAPPENTTAPEKTWQMYANELRIAAGVKIRAFTNTIPAKSQRFGRNVQIWVGQAINKIQAWRAAYVD